MNILQIQKIFLGLLLILPLSTVLADVWCPKASVNLSPVLSLTGAQLYNLDGDYPGSHNHNYDGLHARWLAGNYCETRFTVSNPASYLGANGGEALLASVLAPPNYLQPSYNFSQGLTFRCKLCGYSIAAPPDIVRPPSPRPERPRPPRRN